MTNIRIAEDANPEKRLGRNINHDPRSRAFAFPAGVVASVRHERRSPVLDQGDLGSCTGNAAVGALGTDPFDTKVALDETLAVKIYGMGTGLDPYPGTYPPEDTGSDGLSVAKACQKLGLISGYQHAFTLAAALTALQDYALITGVSWYSSFDDPDADGLVKLTSDAYVRGGHEFEVIGCDLAKRQIECVNSWGTGWGIDGHFFIGFDDWQRLLSEDGDVTVLLPPTVPAPTPVPPVDLDAKLWADLKVWARAKHINDNKIAAANVRAWAAAKGYK